MAWGNQRNFRPTGEGRGGGSGGSFLPSPGGAPPTAPPRPPGAVPAPAGRIPPKKWKYPRYGYSPTPKPYQRGRYWGDQVRSAEKMWEDWMLPDGAFGSPAGWHIPAGWTKCPEPDCPDEQPTAMRWAAATLCPSPGVFNCEQLSGSGVPWGTPHATRVWCLAGTNHDTSLPQFRITSSWIRTSPAITEFPQYEVGFVYLPEQFAGLEPRTQAGPMERTYGGNQIAPAIGAAAKPMVEFGPGSPPGGTPGVHPPAPPRPPDKERKEPPWNYGAPGKLYGALTEAADVAACYVEAKGGSTAGLGTRGAFMEAWKMAGSGAPFDHLAFQKCMTAAMAKDAAIGALAGGAAKRLNRSPYASKRPGGYRGGGWGTRMH